MRARGTIGAALAGIFLGCAAPAIAQSAAERAHISQALSRGALIYSYDQAAWHGTDALFAKHKQVLGDVGGWIVDGPADAPVIIFHDKDATDPKAIYVAEFRNGKLASGRLLGPSDDRTISAERKRLIAAKRAANQTLAESKVGACADKPFNSVVLPPPTAGGPVLVYLLTPQTTMDAVPIGGHYLVEVPSEGTPTFRRFTNSCLALSIPSGGQSRGVLFVTHLLDPVPTEVHVFSSLAARLPLAVGTGPDRIWLVEGARGIQLLDQNKGR